MKIKRYSIDGKFGRAEYDILEQQNGKDTTYNIEERDDTGNYLDFKNFIEGLPEGITKDDYFRMVLLGAIRSLKNSTYKNGNNMKDIVGNLKDINTQLGNLNQRMDKLTEVIVLINGGSINK